MATLAARPTTVRAGWTYRAIWSKSLRAYRLPILAWGIGLGLLVMAITAASPSVAQATSQASLSQTIQSFKFFGDPVAIGTPLGYVTFKMVGLLPLFLGIWVVIAGAHMIRGDEERGSLDLVLGEPVSRARVFGEKVIAFALGITLIGVLIWLGLLLGLLAAKLPIDMGGDTLAIVNLVVNCFVYGALALFFSQFTRTAGGAAGIAGAYMAVDFLVAGAMRSGSGPEWISRLTINYYSELSKPLIPTYGTNGGALLVMLAMSVVLVGVSIWLFATRDAGDVVALGFAKAVRPRPAPIPTLNRARGDVSLRGITLLGLAKGRMAILWWILGIGVYGLYGVFIASSAEKAFSDAFKASGFVQALFSGKNFATNSGFIAGIEFTFIPFAVALAAMFFAIGWASDLDHGRLETTLGEPIARWRAPLERFVTVVVGSLALGVVAWLAPLLGAAITGFSLHGSDMAIAGLGMIPLMLLTGALVYAVSGVLSSGMILGLVGGLVSVSFLLELLQGELKLPEWVINLSIFHAYNVQFSTAQWNFNWPASLIMLGLTVVLLAIGTYRFTQADLGK